MFALIVTAVLGPQPFVGLLSRPSLQLFINSAWDDNALQHGMPALHIATLRSKWHLWRRRCTKTKKCHDVVKKKTDVTSLAVQTPVDPWTPWSSPLAPNCWKAGTLLGSEIFGNIHFCIRRLIEPDLAQLVCRPTTTDGSGMRGWTARTSFWQRPE